MSATLMRCNRHRSAGYGTGPAEENIGLAEEGLEFGSRVRKRSRGWVPPPFFSRYLTPRRSIAQVGAPIKLYHFLFLGLAPLELASGNFYIPRG